MLATTLAEWSLHRHSGWTTRLAVIALIATVLVVFSAHNNISGTIAQFEQSVEFLTGSGGSLQDALAAPTSTSTDGDATTIDNPVRYDLERVGLAMRAVQGVTVIGTVLDTMTFIVLPLLMLVVGAHTATLDIRSGMRKVRATRTPMHRLVLARAAALWLHSLLIVVVVAVGAIVANIAIDALLPDPTVGGAVNFVASDAAPIAPLAAKIGFSVAVGGLFGLIGLAIGEVTRSTSWPLVIVAAALFMLPFVSVWDPRNLVAVAAMSVFDFWGQFSLRPPIAAPTTTAVFALTGYGIVALLAALVIARGRSRMAT